MSKIDFNPVEDCLKWIITLKPWWKKKYQGEKAFIIKKWEKYNVQRVHRLWVFFFIYKNK